MARMTHLERIRDLVYQARAEEAFGLVHGPVSFAYIVTHQGHLSTTTGWGQGDAKGYGDGSGDGDSDVPLRGRGYGWRSGYWGLQPGRGHGNGDGDNKGGVGGFGCGNGCLSRRERGGTPFDGFSFPPRVWEMR